MGDEIEPAPGPTYRLPILTRFSYGVGHVLNDLCASMWFTYLLIFYHKVLGLNNIMAGNLLLIGQVADALATPFVGYESDRINGFCGYGKRKSWHLLGSLCVAASFAFIFMPAVGQDYTYYQQYPGNSYWTVMYYAPFIVIFQFGWASTQISHLSLIPSLSTCEHVKVGLNSIRYAFTVISNLTVYVIALLLLSLNQCDTCNKDIGGGDITHDDSSTFKYMAIIVIGTGSVFTLIFHLGTKESTADSSSSAELSVSVRRRMRVLNWFKTRQFYVVGVLYMCTRLIVNISQVYLSMYLTESLSLSKKYIAIVPLVIYVSGFLFTFPIKAMSKKLGKKIIYVAGLVLVIGACVWFYLLQASDDISHFLVMGAGALNGIGGSTILVLSLSFTADLIDSNTESAAFVYGAMSFTDKLSNGLAVQIIQILHPCKTVSCCAACGPYYKGVMTFVPMGFAVIAFIALLMIRKRQTEYTLISNPNSSDNVRDYGSINNSKHGSINSNGALPSDNYEASPDSEIITEPNIAVLPDRQAGLHVPPVSRQRHPSSGGSTNNGSTPRKPSFIVGSTPA